jgi:hypothetical protein
MNDELERVIESLIDELCDQYERQHRSEILWQALVLDGNFTLLSKLHNAEIKFSGYGTLIVPTEGFSDNNRVHNMVIDWCREHKVRLFNVSHHIAILENAQSWKEMATTF